MKSPLFRHGSRNEPHNTTQQRSRRTEAATTRRTEHHGTRYPIHMEEPFLSAKLTRHLHVFLLLGHLVVILLAMAHRPHARPGHELGRTGADLLHQLVGHPGHHVRLWRHPRPARHQAQARHRRLHARGARRPVRPVRIRADAHRRRQHPLRRRAHRIHRAIRRFHGGMLAVRGAHRTVFP